MTFSLDATPSFDEGNGPLVNNDVAGGEERDMQGDKLCLIRDCSHNITL